MRLFAIAVAGLVAAAVHVADAAPGAGEPAPKPPAAPSSAPGSTSTRPAAATPKASAPVVITMEVTQKGFVPNDVRVKAGQPVTLSITRKTEQTCAYSILVPDYGIEKELPLNQTVEVSFTPTKSGTVRYGCQMGLMISGVLRVE